MSYNGYDIAGNPLWLDSASYDAKNDRRWFADIANAGVLASGDFAVTVTPATMTLNVAAGRAWVGGLNVTEQGTYRVYASAGGTITVPAASGVAPRIDTVILRVFDDASDASGFNKARVELVPGTPTGGTTLGTLAGAASLTALTDASKSVIVLGYVLVPQSAVALTNTATNVLDGRTRARVGSGNLSVSSRTVLHTDVEYDHTAASKVDITQGAMLIPAGAIGPNGSAHIILAGDCLANNGTAANRVFRGELKFGTTVAWDSGPSDQVTQDADRRAWVLEAWLINAYRGVLDQSRLWGTFAIGDAQAAAIVGTGGISDVSANGRSYGGPFQSPLMTIDFDSAQTMFFSVTLVNATATAFRLEEAYMECYVS